MTGPFSEERSRVRYVLVDGLKFEIKPEDRARTKGRASAVATARRRDGEVADRPDRRARRTRRAGGPRRGG